MVGNTCHICSKLLRFDIGAILSDREGRSFHIACWCQMMDVRAQATREQLAAQRKRLADQRHQMAKMRKFINRRRRGIESPPPDAPEA